MALLSTGGARAQSAVVRAVLFYTPSCSHCQKVIQEVLPPLQEKYGEQLSILGINVSDQTGQAYYRGTIERFQLPQERIGVPLLVVGETTLLGSFEIPEQLPGLIASGLDTGGIDWPDIPDLDQALAAEGLETPKAFTPAPAGQTGESPTAAEATAAPIDQTSQLTLPPGSQAGPLARFAQDRLGNSLAVIVLLALIASVLLTSYQVIQLKVFGSRSWPDWFLPVISLIGLGVAVYMSYIEITQREAICGPVGDCNSVQQSPYARLFGVLPVGVLGMLGYAFIGAAWIVVRYGKNRWQPYGALIIWGLALFGTLFSIYLTFLEPFVIGATCVWCLTSAIVMLLLLWAATPPAVDAWENI